jgi:hypothetical protein
VAVQRGTRRPRISFGIIVLNGEPFTRYCLRSLYPLAHENIVVEGAHSGARVAATPDGHSLDGTLDTLRRFKRDEDPDDKLRIVTRDGFWPDVEELSPSLGRTRTSQSRAYADLATGDYLWQVDIDEFYLPKGMQAVIDMLAADPSITAVCFPFVDFWARPQYAVGSWKYRRRGVAHRLFKWGEGYSYAKHRPPTVVDQNGRDLRTVHWVSPSDMRRRGIFMHHYSHLFPIQMERKALVYAAERPDFFAEIGSWRSEAYVKLGRPYHVEQHYRTPSWLMRFAGEHPPEVLEMMRDISEGRLPVELRRTDDIEQLLDSWWYPVGAAVVERLEPVDRALSYTVPRLKNLARGRMPDRLRHRFAALLSGGGGERRGAVG